MTALKFAQGEKSVELNLTSEQAALVLIVTAFVLVLKK